MCKRLLAGSSAAVLVAVAAAASLSAWQKPIKEEVFFADPIPPPGTGPEMAAEADAVAVIRYTGRSELIESTPAGERIPPDAEPAGDMPILRSTDYIFEVLEILKIHGELPQIGGELRINLLGGTKDKGAYVLRRREQYRAELVPQRAYLAFLRWGPLQQRLYLAWGRAGLFEINSGKLRSVDRGGWRHDGSDATAFIGSLNPSKGTGR